MHLVFPQPLFSPVKKHKKPNKHTSLLPASLMRLVPLGLTNPKPAQAAVDHGERPRWRLRSEITLTGMYPKSEGSTGDRQGFEMSAALNQRRSLSSLDPDLDLNWVLHSLNLMPISWLRLPAPIGTSRRYSLHHRGAGHHWQLLSKFARFIACLNYELC